MAGDALSLQEYRLSVSSLVVDAHAPAWHRPAVYFPWLTAPTDTTVDDDVLMSLSLCDNDAPGVFGAVAPSASLRLVLVVGPDAHRNQELVGSLSRAPLGEGSDRELTPKGVHMLSLPVSGQSLSPEAPAHAAFLFACEARGSEGPCDEVSGALACIALVSATVVVNCAAAGGLEDVTEELLLLTKSLNRVDGVPSGLLSATHGRPTLVVVVPPSLCAAVEGSASEATAPMWEALRQGFSAFVFIGHGPDSADGVRRLRSSVAASAGVGSVLLGREILPGMLQCALSVAMESMIERGTVDPAYLLVETYREETERVRDAANADFDAAVARVLGQRPSPTAEEASLLLEGEAAALERRALDQAASMPEALLKNLCAQLSSYFKFESRRVLATLAERASKLQLQVQEVSSAVVHQHCAELEEAILSQLRSALAAAQAAAHSDLRQLAKVGLAPLAPAPPPASEAAPPSAPVSPPPAPVASPMLTTALQVLRDARAGCVDALCLTAHDRVRAALATLPQGAVEVGLPRFEQTVAMLVADLREGVHAEATSECGRAASVMLEEVGSAVVAHDKDDAALDVAAAHCHLAFVSIMGPWPGLGEQEAASTAELLQQDVLMELTSLRMAVVPGNGGISSAEGKDGGEEPLDVASPGASGAMAEEDRTASEARVRAAEELLVARDKEIEDMRMKLERAKFYGSSRSGLRAPASGPVTKQGYIVKRGRFRKSWLKRWFVLSGTQIEYFKDKGAGRKGVIVLLPTTSVRHSEPVTGSSRHLTLPASSSVRLATAQLALKSDDPYDGLETPPTLPAPASFEFEIVKPSGGRSYLLRVDSETELSEWVKAITHNIMLLQGKKSAAW